MKRFLMRVHDKIFGEPEFYAIYDDEGNVVSLSAAALLIKFDEDLKPKAADRYETEAIYAGEYYYDPRWMVANENMGEFLTQGVVKVVGGKEFDRLFDVVFPGDEED